MPATKSQKKMRDANFTLSGFFVHTSRGNGVFESGNCLEPKADHWIYHDKANNLHYDVHGLAALEDLGARLWKAHKVDQITKADEQLISEWAKANATPYQEL